MGGWHIKSCFLPFGALQERLYNPEYQNFNVKDKQEDTVLELFDLMCAGSAASRACRDGVQLHMLLSSISLGCCLRVAVYQPPSPSS